MQPPIPPVFDSDLLTAVSVLTRAGHAYRSVLFLVTKAAGSTAFDELLKHEDLLNNCDLAINAWRQQLGHDVEDENDI